MTAGIRGVVAELGDAGGVTQPLSLPPSPLAPRALDGVAEFIEAGPDSSPIIASTSQHRPKRARRGDIIAARYVVDGQIGRGGMGRVLKVHHQVLGKAFALKLIRAPMATNQRVREMFYREARVASALSHDHICTIVDFGQDPEFGLFMVMELLEGVTIFDKLRSDGPTPPKAACDVMSQVAEAVRYIHSRSIIHGDIKSENILLTRTPERRRVVKLLDFGLARMKEAQGSRGVEGTPEYLAPERVMGEAASLASDVYALGMLFWEILVGRLPFTGGMEEVFRMHLERPIPRLSTLLGGSLDERADELILRATAKNPADRHADAAAFLYELRTLMNMLGMDTGRRRSSGVDAASSRKRSRDMAVRAQAVVEVFEHAPVPLAAVDAAGVVRVANQAFHVFLGLEDTTGVDLASTSFTAIYPTLADDLRTVRESRTTLKRLVYLSESDGTLVEVAVILSASPDKAGITGGDVHMTLHPLGRVPRRTSTSDARSSEDKTRR